MNCPECQATSNAVVVLFTRAHPLGRKRRYKCRTCGHRWTVFGNDLVSNRGPAGSGRLTVEQVERILCSELGPAALAQEMQVSRTLISAIRNGRKYRSVLPELRRNT